MLESLFKKDESLQNLRRSISKTSANGCLVHNMSSKAYKIDQGATEMFISEFEYEESLRNVISEIYKNGDAKKKKQVLKGCLNYMR